MPLAATHSHRTLNGNVRRGEQGRVWKEYISCPYPQYTHSPKSLRLKQTQCGKNQTRLFKLLDRGRMVVKLKSRQMGSFIIKEAVNTLRKYLKYVYLKYNFKSKIATPRG